MIKSSWFMMLAILILASLPNFARAEAFKLLTVDTARLPTTRYVAGLQELGVKLGPVFIDTNPALDLLATGNLGLKSSIDVSERVSVALGARYLQFFGSSVANQLALQKSSAIQRFDLNFRGYTAFLSSTFRASPAAYHLGVQSAEISGSRVLGLIAASEIYLSENWLVAIESGYEFQSRAPRLSLGFVRTGPTFGTRLGLTYLDLKDSFVRYAGPVPVIDFYWLFGGT